MIAGGFDGWAVWDALRECIEGMSFLRCSLGISLRRRSWRIVEESGGRLGENARYKSQRSPPPYSLQLCSPLFASGSQNSIANRHLSGRHRWIDYSQDDFNASQVTPEWHSWIHHIRKDVPTDDVIMKQLSPPWKAVSFFLLSSWVLVVMGTVALFVRKTSH